MAQFYKVLVSKSYASRIIRSLLNTDIEITDKYRFADYDIVVNEQFDLIGDGKLFKLEYKGNLAGYFIWDGSVAKSWFLKPIFRSGEYLKMLNFAVNSCFFSATTINEENTKIEEVNKIIIQTYKSV